MGHEEFVLEFHSQVVFVPETISWCLSAFLGHGDTSQEVGPFELYGDRGLVRVLRDAVPDLFLNSPHGAGPSVDGGSVVLEQGSINLLPPQWEFDVGAFELHVLSLQDSPGAHLPNLLPSSISEARYPKNRIVAMFKHRPVAFPSALAFRSL